ncbi:hypothetical protein AALD74_06855 [Lachnospiraceae bacterium 48-21]|jgi:hypothetical protein
MMQEEKLETVLYELEQVEKLEQEESEIYISSNTGGYFTLLCC